jgi:hypothetical protein
MCVRALNATVHDLFWDSGFPPPRAIGVTFPRSLKVEFEPFQTGAVPARAAAWGLHAR